MSGPAQKTVTTLDVITGPDTTGPVGTVRISRSASGLQASVDGAAPAALGGAGVASIVAGTGISVDATDPAAPIVASTGTVGGYDAYYRNRAAGFLGTSFLSCQYKGFIAGVEGWTQNLVGASGVGQAIAPGESTDAVSSVGGIMIANTGTATTGSSQLIPAVSAGRAPTLAAANVNVKFYRACRMRTLTAVDANMASGVGSTNWLMGILGANSTTKFSVAAVTNAGATHYVTSTVSIDVGANGDAVGWHVIESWHDGVKAWICVDGETPVGVADTTWWSLTTVNNSSALIVAGKVTGATDYTCEFEWALWCVAAP